MSEMEVRNGGCRDQQSLAETERHTGLGGGHHTWVERLR